MRACAAAVRVAHAVAGASPGVLSLPGVLAKRVLYILAAHLSGPTSQQGQRSVPSFGGLGYRRPYLDNAVPGFVCFPGRTQNRSDPEPAFVPKMSI